MAGPRGNLIVGQSGGCTAVINCSLAGVLDEALAHTEIDGIYGMLNGVQGLIDGEVVDLRRESKAVLAGLRSAPSAALGSCRFRPDDEQLHQILDRLRGYGVRYLLYIGGNDSADISDRLDRLARESGYELFVIGLPKTIDNDLPCTDHCPGYGSAARYLAVSTLEAGLDTEAMRRFDPIKLIEIMGRDAGWLAGAAALGKRVPADAPHLVYFPEHHLDVDRFLADVESVYTRLGYVVAIIPELITSPDGSALANAKPNFVDAFGHAYFDSPAAYLVREIRQRLGLRARFDKPGTLQRMSMPLTSRVDREEAYLTGRVGVREALAGQSGQMVTLLRKAGDRYACDTGLAPLADIANSVKLLPREFVNQEANFITPAFVEYAKPLLGTPLPKYVRLSKSRVV